MLTIGAPTESSEEVKFVFLRKESQGAELQICGNCGYGKPKKRLRGGVSLLRCKYRKEIPEGRLVDGEFVRENDPCHFKPSYWKPKDNPGNRRLSKREERRKRRKEKRIQERGNNSHRNRDQRRYTGVRPPQRK